MKRCSLFLLTLLVLAGMARPWPAFAQENTGKPGEEVIDFDRPVPGVKPPRAVYRPGPEYDDKDRKKKVTGTVVLSLVVTKDGRAADIKVVQSLNDGLDRQAIKAVSRWTFEPASRDGKPVAARIRVETTFNIR